MKKNTKPERIVFFGGRAVVRRGVLWSFEILLGLEMTAFFLCVK